MNQPVDRRSFAKEIAVAAAALAVTATPAAMSQEPPAQPEQLAETPATPPAELVFQLVRQLEPRPLDESQVAEIRRQIDDYLSRSQALGDFPLTNADEPAFVFSAFRAD